MGFFHFFEWIFETTILLVLAIGSVLKMFFLKRMIIRSFTFIVDK